MLKTLSLILLLAMTDFAFAADRKSPVEKYVPVKISYFENLRDLNENQNELGKFEPGSIQLLSRSGKFYFARQGKHEGWVEFGRTLLPGIGTNRQIKLNQLGVDLIGLLDAGFSNTAISPPGIWTSLFTLAYGAEGKTQAELMQFLGDDPASERLQPFVSISFDSATAIWKRPEIRLTSPFERIAKGLDCEVYDSHLDQNATEQINDWFSSQTNDRIKNFISKIPPETRLLISNVSMLDAQWAIDLKLDEEKKETFTTPFGQTKKIPMLSCNAKLPYFEDQRNGLQVVEFPYLEQELVALLVVPNEKQSLGECLVDLSSEDITNWFKQIDYHPIDLKFPEFEVTSKHSNLAPILSILGLETVFSNAANFSNLTESERLKVSEILQQVTVKVDRRGTEAYQATIGKLVPVSLPDKRDSISVHATRPFLFFVVHKPSNSVLFVTSVVNPFVNKGKMGQ